METDSLPLSGQVFGHGIGATKLVIFGDKIHTISTQVSMLPWKPFPRNAGGNVSTFL